MNEKEFKILTEIENSETILDVNIISQMLKIHVDIVDLIIKEFEAKSYIIQGRITELGYKQLEPYRVRRAILFAAGTGSRLQPITLNTPKPLIKVNGVRMIDTLLDAIIAVGIEDIIIVRGYLGEQFDVLLDKYPNIKFYDNTKYKSFNNIYSAYLVADKFSNAYVMDADLILKSPNIIRKYQYHTNYVGIKVEKTDDWCFSINKKKKTIDSISLGGVDTFLWIGLSYWSKYDGKKLKEDIPKVFCKDEGKNKYWDQVALEFFKDRYNVHIREFNDCDIIEIDTYEELTKLDDSYLNK